MSRMAELLRVLSWPNDQQPIMVAFREKEGARSRISTARSGGGYVQDRGEFSFRNRQVAPGVKVHVLISGEEASWAR